MSVVYYALKGPGKRKSPQGDYVISAPLGAGSHPLVYVDGLVHTKTCGENKSCATRARAFAEFLTSPAIQTAIAFGDDPDAEASRYLLMATTAFWKQPRVTKDPVYAQLSKILNGGTLFAEPAFSQDDVLDALAAEPNAQQSPGAH